MKTATKSTSPETVGRKYEYVRYGVLSRKVGGGGAWYGSSNYKTEEEAREQMGKALRGSRYEVVGGIAIDFGDDGGERYERKMVRVVNQCEVLAVGVGPM